MISDDINQVTRAFKVMLPRAKSFKDSEKLFVVGIIVEFGCLKGPGEESDQMDLTVI